MPKPARAVFDNIFAFPPNRETLGATAYFIVKNDVNILLDCPAWDAENQQFLRDQGGVRWLLITHRGGIGKHVKEIQQTLGCEILIQEQEAYLLPGLTVTTFQKEFTLSPTSQVIWTPGHSPGSSCLYEGENGGVLFTGRHLLPNRQGNPVPLRTSKTFHWRRQINSVNMLREVFSSETLQYICPGANTGFLRGKGAIAKAYEKLVQLDLDALLQAKPGL
jgi:glyoxylase-like metal-dependent hydrolase (beta-lactamase superfamily II)